MTEQYAWGADAPVSLPQPLRQDDTVYVDMGGFGFNEFGIVHNFRDADWEIYLPHFSPRAVE